jgi:hypothetical protein
MNLDEPSQPHGAFRIALVALKSLAIAVGCALSVLCLMSAMSALTPVLWVQLVPALIVGLGLPLVAAERLAIDERRARRKGLASDVLAVSWLGFAVLYVAGAFTATSPLLCREADLLSSTWARDAAPVIRWLARGAPEARADAASAEGTASGAGAGRDGGPGDGGDTPDADGEPVVDAGCDVDVEAEGDVEQALDPEVLPELSPAQVLETILPSLVSVSVRRRGQPVSVASGVVVDEQGLIATAASAVAGAATLAVRLADGRWVDAVEVAALDRVAGLALLSIPPGQGLSAARLARDGEVAVGARLLVVGDPLGLAPTVREDVLAQLIDVAGGYRLGLASPATLASLGAAVVDMRGVVVGVALYERPPAGPLPARTAPPGLAAPSELLEAMAGSGSEAVHDQRRANGGALPAFSPVTW